MIAHREHYVKGRTRTHIREIGGKRRTDSVDFGFIHTIKVLDELLGVSKRSLESIAGLVIAG
jgi:hypothetical protein